MMTFSLGSTPRSLVKYNDQSVSAITEVVSGAGVQDAMVLIKTITASSDADVTFDSDIDSTYPIYKFIFTSVHPQTDDKTLNVNFRDGSTAYDAVKTSTYFNASHDEANTATDLSYVASGAGEDLAQATGVQEMTRSIGNDADQSVSGELWLFSPSSTTFVKHWMSKANISTYSNYSFDNFVAGYCNTTSAIDGIQFTMASGNIDAGTFKMYGIKDS